MTEKSGFDPLSLPETNTSNYPEPWGTLAKKRWTRRLGNYAGLKNFGVNITRLEPGGVSSQRHAHAKQDEFIYVLKGTVVLETDAGPETLDAGMCAGFPAGTGNAHRFVNNTQSDVLLLVIGDRTPGESANYPDIDLQLVTGPDGKYRYLHRDGTPY
jgi:uncharacterized cupin superfamily protein